MQENKYKEAGVDVEAGYESVELIKKHVDATKNKGSMSGIGGFGAMFDFKAYDFKDPVLVAGTDGVGTKLEIAREMNIYDTIGIDLVAMCVNDIIAIGAKPLFFLDYIAVDKNEPKKIEQIVKGISVGLKQCDCALIGGETAEMPGVYKKNGFDLAGYVTGMVERDKIIKEGQIKENQVIIGVASSGIHSNGYSLVRSIVENSNLDLNRIYLELDNDKTLGQVLLTPTKIYVNNTLELLEKVNVKGIAHITGGGFYENIKRVTKEYGAKIDLDKLNILPIFNFLQDKGQLHQQEMFGYFNMGIGMVYIVDENDVELTLKLLKDAYVIGRVTKEVDIIVC